MATSHCLEYLTAQASRLKYATHNIGFMKVRMEGRCVWKKKKKKKKTLPPPPIPPPSPPQYTPRVSANKTAMSEWKHGKEGLMNNMDTEVSAVFSK